MEGPGSTGNVVAAVCSFFIPGLGQLVQGRMGKALLHFLIASFLWLLSLLSFGLLFFLPLLMNIWSCYEAAVYVPRLHYFE